MKIHFHTFGCRTNQSETASLIQGAIQSNYEIVRTLEDADILIINTCTVTHKADSDLRHFINKAVKKNPNIKIILTGCLVNIQKEELLKLPNVKGFKIDFPKAEPINPYQTRANLKIQDGCDNFCSYCIVPYARGRAKSLDYGFILEQANALVKAGYKEIILTGINIGNFKGKNKTLIDLLSDLEKIDKLKRIRISSIEPIKELKDLIDYMAQSKKVCRHLHIPLQSGSDAVLKDMKRRYLFSEYQELVGYAKKCIPNCCIGADIICGYPTETDEAFEVTYQALKRLPLSYFHVFSYSKREGTESSKLKVRVQGDVIKARVTKLRSLSEEKKNDFELSQEGQELAVLFEEKKGASWVGFSDNYIRLSLESSENLENCIISVVK